MVGLPTPPRPPPPDGYATWIERAFATLTKILEVRAKAGDALAPVATIFTVETDYARTELADLKQRLEDAKLMLRFVFGEARHQPCGGCGDVEWNEETRRWWFCLGHKLDDLALEDDGTGIPLLTSEARERLLQNAKEPK